MTQPASISFLWHKTYVADSFVENQKIVVFIDLPEVFPTAMKTPRVVKLGGVTMPLRSWEKLPNSLRFVIDPPAPTLAHQVLPKDGTLLEYEYEVKGAIKGTPGSVSDYQLWWAPMHKLTAQIKEQIAQGWEPIGGLASWDSPEGPIVAQALVKRVPR